VHEATSKADLRPTCPDPGGGGAWLAGGVLAQLESYVREVLGPVDVLSRPRDIPGKKCVIEVRDATGQRYFAKAVPRRPWRAEVRAYRRWVPRLGGAACRLLHADAPRGYLVVDAAPGRAATPDDTAAFAAAGEVLGRLHSLPAGAEGSGADDWEAWCDLARRQTELVLRECRAVGVAVDEQLLRERSEEALRRPLPIVPTHGDYQPHNWVVDEAGAVRVIDFGGSALRPAAYDLTRLMFRACWDRPDLATELLRGYGRPLEAEEVRFVELYLGIVAARGAYRGRRAQMPFVRRRADAALRRIAAGEPDVVPGFRTALAGVGTAV
jgi:Ser/Thr protein kinase RdoA (MazF antagonist)